MSASDAAATSGYAVILPPHICACTSDWLRLKCRENPMLYGMAAVCVRVREDVMCMRARARACARACVRACVRERACMSVRA